MELNCSAITLNVAGLRALGARVGKEHWNGENASKLGFPVSEPKWTDKCQALNMEGHLCCVGSWQMCSRWRVKAWTTWPNHLVIVRDGSLTDMRF